MNAALQELAKKREARHGVPSTGAGDEDAAVSTIQACHRSKSDPEKAQEAKPIAPSASDTGYRCWICLDDSDSLEGMISPCACVGTNQYVHQECVKTYCLQHLSNHEPSSRELNVACPICKTQYTITEQSAAATSAASGDGGSASGAVSAADGLGGNWSEFTQWSTDRHLLLRHGRFLLLVAPLVGASLISWSWLLAYWHDLYVHGPGEPLMEGEPLGDRLDPAVDSADEPEALLRSSTVNLLSPVQELLLGARSWLPQGFVDAAEELLPAAFSRAEGAAASAYTTPAFDVAGSAASERQPHPAGISKKWSVLYVWLQYVQWYKVLCWLLTMVVGGAEGVVPGAIQDVFRVDELLLASETRAHIFLCGQCVPFVLTKVRHFLVTWTRKHWVIQTLFYSIFTSHAEVACNLACDSCSGALLVHDWLTSVANDVALRRSMRRLRSGNFIVAPYQADTSTVAPAPGPAAADEGVRRRRGPLAAA